jgi:hypothetical protein
MAIVADAPDRKTCIGSPTAWTHGPASYVSSKLKRVSKGADHLHLWKITACVLPFANSRD